MEEEALRPILAGSPDGLLRRGLESFLSEEGFFPRIASSPEELIRELNDARRESVGRPPIPPAYEELILDYQPSRGWDRSLITLVKEKSDAPLLVLGREVDVNLVLELFKDSARAYILHESGEKELLAALSAVTAGGEYLDGKLRQQLIGRLFSPGDKRAPDPLQRLTRREKEVFFLLGRNYQPGEVATTLGLCEKTVWSHLFRLGRKLGVPSRELPLYSLACLLTNEWPGPELLKRHERRGKEYRGS